MVGLPPDSALARAMDPDLAAWKLEHELSATATEVIDMGFRQLYAILASSVQWKGKKPQPWSPIRIPRPGEPPPEEKKPTTVAEIRMRFQM